MRQKLEDFLATCPDAFCDEDAYALLINLGLEHVADLPIARVVEIAKRAGRIRCLARLLAGSG